MTLVTTSKAAEQLGVHPATLWRWQKAGIATPAYITPGGQARWDLEKLTDQLNHRTESWRTATRPQRRLPE